jgi:alcohol dehydrogenase
MPRLIVGERTLAQLPELLEKQGHHEILLCTGASSLREGGHLQKLETACEHRGITLHIRSVSGEPTPEIVDEMTSSYWDAHISAVVAIGGGSVIDAAKAAAAMIAESRSSQSPCGITDYLEGVGTREPAGLRLPLFVVPTTAGTGSEATKNAVISRLGEQGFKKSLRHDAYIPDAAILDGELAMSTPPAVTAASGLDAVTQLLEAFVSKKASDFTDMVCREGLHHAGAVLRDLVEGSSDAHMRTRMAYAAYLSGVALANAGLGVVHGAASVLGAMHEIPHGVVCGTLLFEASRRVIEKLDGTSAAYEKYGMAGYLLTHTEPLPFIPEKGHDLLLEYLETAQNQFGIQSLGEYGFTEAELKSAAVKTGLKETPADLNPEAIEALLGSRLQ